MSHPSPDRAAVEARPHDDYDDERSRIRGIAPRIIVLALAMVLIQVLFAYSYMGAFGKPKTSEAPFVVVSSTEGNAGYIANKLNGQKGQPVSATISTDKEAALAKLRSDDAVAVYVFHPTQDGKANDELYYASAEGAARSQIATTVGQRIAAQGQRQLTMHDVVPAKASDPRGTAPFYLVLAWMIGGYLLPAAMATTVGARARTALGARLRLLLFAGYAILSALAGTWVAMTHYDALGGSFWKIAGLGAMLVFAVSTFTYGLTSLFGSLGVGLAILLFVILGNPSSGGAFNYDVLPQPWRSVGPYLPNGAGVDAVRSLSYFDGVHLERPLWVVLAWCVAGLWMIFMVGNNTYRATPSHVSRPENEGGGLVGEHFEHAEHERHARVEGAEGEGSAGDAVRRTSRAADGVTPDEDPGSAQN